MRVALRSASLSVPMYQNRKPHRYAKFSAVHHHTHWSPARPAKATKAFAGKSCPVYKCCTDTGIPFRRPGSCVSSSLAILERTAAQHSPVAPAQSHAPRGRPRVTNPIGCADSTADVPSSALCVRLYIPPTGNVTGLHCMNWLLSDMNWLLSDM